MRFRLAITLFLGVLSTGNFHASQALAGEILAYSLDGVLNQPVESVAASSVAEGISGVDLVRGAGIGVTNLTNGFSANGWNGVTSLEIAETQGAFFQFGLNVNSGYRASLSTLDLSLRRSALNAPMNYQIQASLDNFASSRIEIATFNYFGRTSGSPPAQDPLIDDPFYYMTNDLAGRPNTPRSPGDAIPTVDLSTFGQLQNLSENSEVLFRLYAWGNELTVGTNTVALGRMVGPAIGGSVTAIPEPSSVALALAGGLVIAGVRTRRGRRLLACVVTK